MATPSPTLKIIVKAGDYSGARTKNDRFPILSTIMCSLSTFGGGFLGDTRENQFRLYLELDSTNFGLPIVNLDYLRHYRLIDESFRSIRGLLSMFSLQ